MSRVVLDVGVVTVVDAVLACSCESVAAFLPDGIASSFVFVIRCDIADRGVQPCAVVFVADPVELD